MTDRSGDIGKECGLDSLDESDQGKIAECAESVLALYGNKGMAIRENQHLRDSMIEWMHAHTPHTIGDPTTLQILKEIRRQSRLMRHFASGQQTLRSRDVDECASFCSTIALELHAALEIKRAA